MEVNDSAAAGFHVSTATKKGNPAGSLFGFSVSVCSLNAFAASEIVTKRKVVLSRASVGDFRITTTGGE